MTHLKEKSRRKVKFEGKLSLSNPGAARSARFNGF
jgi:hypothetical protein